VRVGCAQLAFRGFDVPAGLPRIVENLAYLDSYYRSQESCDLLVLSEFWLSSPAGPVGYQDSAVSISSLSGPLGAFARDNHVHLAANVIERSASAKIYDTSVLIDDAGGQAAVYRSVTAGTMQGSPLSAPERSDAAAVAAPSWIPVTSTRIGRIGLAVGSDLAYPEPFTSMMLDEVDIVLHAAKEATWASGNWQQLKAGRCIEGGFFLASANNADSTDSVGSWGDSFGGSRILDPQGALLTASTSDHEDYVVAEIDLASSRTARESPRLMRRAAPQWRAQFTEPDRPARASRL
jgi:predicted amidohydrolase